MESHSTRSEGRPDGAAPPQAPASEPVIPAGVVPHLRGWLHAGMFPAALIGGVTLVLMASTTGARVAAAIFGLTASLLFGVSALYHRGKWRPRVKAVLRRLDHANIFLIIAGSYTPFAVVLLPPDSARLLLILIWSGALAGVAFRVIWVNAPRWLYTPIYIALGWAALFFLPDFLRQGGTAVLSLIVIGGLLYSLGAVVYGLKRPNPSPRWFGFHEVFHALTIAAFLTHFVAAALTVTIAAT
jgi:hemolysin III